MFLDSPLSNLLDLYSTLFRASRALTGHGNLHVVGFQNGQDFDMWSLSGRGLHVALVDLDFRRKAVVGFSGKANPVCSVPQALSPG